MKYIWLMLYIGVIVAANWAISKWGFVSVGFGLTAPAGVYFAGLSFGFRDMLHEEGGRAFVLAAILCGALASWSVSPTFAVASGVAFFVSELIDMAIYTPLREKSFTLGVICSNAVGSVVDSMLFLYLAFGSINFWFGNSLGKWWTIIPVLLVMKGYRALFNRDKLLLESSESTLWPNPELGRTA